MLWSSDPCFRPMRRSFHHQNNDKKVSLVSVHSLVSDPAKHNSTVHFVSWFQSYQPNPLRDEKNSMDVTVRFYFWVRSTCLINSDLSMMGFTNELTFVMFLRNIITLIEKQPKKIHGSINLISIWIDQ